MSEEKPTPASGKEFNDVRKELRKWKRWHPKANLAEIERETMKRMAQVQAQIIEELSQPLSTEERLVGEEISLCPEYQTKCSTGVNRSGSCKETEDKAYISNAAIGYAKLEEPGFFLMDERLGLLPGGLTPFVHECLVRLAVWMPFQ